MNFEASYTQNFRVTEVRIISSVDIFAMIMTLSALSSLNTFVADRQKSFFDPVFRFYWLTSPLD